MPTNKHVYWSNLPQHLDNETFQAKNSKLHKQEIHNRENKNTKNWFRSTMVSAIREQKFNSEAGY